MKRIFVVLAAAVAVTLGAGYVFLLGAGSVVGQEAGLWSTTKAAVQTRVFRVELVALTPDKYVTRGDAGRDRFFALMRQRGFTLRDQYGAGLIYEGPGGARCDGGSRMFTSSLMVFDVPRCRS